MIFFSSLDDYTKITTPRQDVLFKKGWYLNRSKFSTNSRSASTNSHDANYLSLPLSANYENYPNEVFCNEVPYFPQQGGYMNEGKLYSTF